MVETMYGHGNWLNMMRGNESMKLHIGTSGFSYPYWKDKFYPEKLASSKWLAYYSSQFNTLELNSSFYRFPVLKTLEKQRDQTPPGFIFSVKAHKIITHTLRMKNAKEKVLEFTHIVEDGLREKLGCILFQLPPSFAYTEENLDNILKSIPHLSRNVVEFRHISWWNEKVWETLKKHNLTFCNVSYPTLPTEPLIRDNIFYLRMHGVPELFKSSYNDLLLKQLALKIPKAEACYIYFNNTMYEAGYENARKLRSFIQSG